MTHVCAQCKRIMRQNVPTRMHATHAEHRNASHGYCTECFSKLCAARGWNAQELMRRAGINSPPEMGLNPARA